MIDYDFGPTPTHGIFREIPDVVPGSVEVESPTAPDQFVVAESPVETIVKIGDPKSTITGRHRYRIDYTLVLDAVRIGERFAFDAVGFGWEVPISDIVVSITADTQLESPTRLAGTPWDESTMFAHSGRHRSLGRGARPPLPGRRSHPLVHPRLEDQR